MAQIWRKVHFLKFVILNVLRVYTERQRSKKIPVKQVYHRVLEWETCVEESKIIKKIQPLMVRQVEAVPHIQ